MAKFLNLSTSRYATTVSLDSIERVDKGEDQRAVLIMRNQDVLNLDLLYEDFLDVLIEITAARGDGVFDVIDI